MNEKNKRGTNSQNDKISAGKQLSLPIAEEKERNMPTADQGKDFETTLIELETVVQQLEGELKLEDALKLFDRGMQLSQHCEEFLKSAEQKIEILKKAANGRISTENFNEESLQTN